MKLTILILFVFLFFSGIIAAKDYENDHENAWIIDTSIKDRVVRIQAVSSRLIIDFRPKEENLQSFARRKGCLTYFWFECAKNKDGECNFASPYNLFVERKPVEVIKIKDGKSKIP